MPLKLLLLHSSHVDKRRGLICGELGCCFRQNLAGECLAWASALCCSHCYGSRKSGSSPQHGQVGCRTWRSCAGLCGLLQQEQHKAPTDREKLLWLEREPSLSAKNWQKKVDTGEKVRRLAECKAEEGSPCSPFNTLISVFWCF